jgi:hypothetical protein
MARGVAVHLEFPSELPAVESEPLPEQFVTRLAARIAGPYYEKFITLRRGNIRPP